jgi:hypothetical protein
MATKKEKRKNNKKQTKVKKIDFIQINETAIFLLLQKQPFQCVTMSCVPILKNPFFQFKLFPISI